MKKITIFIIRLVKEINDDEIVAISGELTYKLLLSIFPFFMFLISVLGFLNIDKQELLKNIDQFMPPEVVGILSKFITDVVEEKHFTLLSAGLFASIYSSSSGFRAVIRGINKSYGIHERRSFISNFFISILLMLIFTLSIILSLVTLIFGDHIFNFILKYFQPGVYFNMLFSSFGYFFTLFVIMTAVILIYKISCLKKITFFEAMPGAIVTIVTWLVASKIFKIYVDNFSNYSKIYGSIGHLFVFLLWLNLISFILLFGSEVNSLLSHSKDD